METLVDLTLCHSFYSQDPPVQRSLDSQPRNSPLPTCRELSTARDTINIDCETRPCVSGSGLHLPSGESPPSGGILFSHKTRAREWAGIDDQGGPWDRQAQSSLSASLFHPNSLNHSTPNSTPLASVILLSNSANMSPSGPFLRRLTLSVDVVPLRTIFHPRSIVVRWHKSEDLRETMSNRSDTARVARPARHHITLITLFGSQTLLPNAPV